LEEVLDASAPLNGSQRGHVDRVGVLFYSRDTGPRDGRSRNGCSGDGCSGDGIADRRSGDGIADGCASHRNGRSGNGLSHGCSGFDRCRPTQRPARRPNLGLPAEHSPSQPGHRQSGADG
jgi:hypothetical protein